jgi:isopentenyldiphosphate isomerase
MRIQLVDGQDQVIAAKERSQVDYRTDIYRAAALWLTNSQGQALLAKRSAQFATVDRPIDGFTTQSEEVEALEWVDTAQLKQDVLTNPDKYVPTMPQIVKELGL